MPADVRPTWQPVVLAAGESIVGASRRLETGAG